MSKQIFGVAIINGEFKPMTVEDSLDSYYKLLGCSVIDIPMRRIGGVYYDIVCDEEGLYNSDNRIQMIHKDTNVPMLVGNLFICKDDGKGELKSLDNEDVEKIRQSWKFHTILGDY